MISKASVLIFVALVSGAPALADEAMPESAGGRYMFSKVDDGFVRLDTQTGEVSLCSRQTVGWACLAAPEDRAALENEIARLRSENAILKRDLLARGLPLPPGISPAPPAADVPNVVIQLPSDAEVDRVIGFVGRVFRRLIETLNAQNPAPNKS